MGLNMVKRLVSKGHVVVAYNRSPEPVAEAIASGAKGVHSLQELVDGLEAPRTVWVMVSHSAVDTILADLLPLLSAGDTVIDGGNSPYRETIRRAGEITAQGIKFLDVGVSGGPGGALNGAAMMAGGDRSVYDALDTAGFFRDTNVPEGYAYMGPAGAGHFVKMIHNGIEYGMMQSLAEGFDLLRHSSEYQLDLNVVSGVYEHGTVITSSLMSWLSNAYKKYGPDLNDISGKASASGEGKWTSEAGEREHIPMPVINDSIVVRTATQTKPSYQGKVVSAMRGEFGQHPVTRTEGEPEVL
jgi:6-phosphogluconate dehydrogenase